MAAVGVRLIAAEQAEATEEPEVALRWMVAVEVPVGAKVKPVNVEAPEPALTTFAVRVPEAGVEQAASEKALRVIVSDAPETRPPPSWIWTTGTVVKATQELFPAKLGVVITSCG